MPVFSPRPGKRRQLGRQGFDTKRAAEAALAEAIGEVNRGMAVSRSSITVGEYLHEWIESARPSLRPTTARGYQQSVERLTARLGRVRLQALTPMPGAAVLRRVAGIGRSWRPPAGTTHATLALKAGVHPKVVSERLGHATVGITLDLYSHVVPSLAKDAAEQIMSATYGDRL